MARYESAGTWFSAEEKAKREAFKVGDRVRYNRRPDDVWYGTVVRVNGTGYMIRFEHDGHERGLYYKNELTLMLPRVNIAGIEFALPRIISPLERLRAHHARYDRRDVTRDDAFALVQHYHLLIGELLNAPAPKSEAQVAAEIADRLESAGYCVAPRHVRFLYQLPERR
jgi:hypothetical protein